MGNSPRYVGFLDPPYNVTLTDDSGRALNLTGCTGNSFSLTLFNPVTKQARTCVGTWTTPADTTGKASYQWTNADMSTAGQWWLYTTVLLPGEPSLREFDPEVIDILPGTVGAGAAPPGVLPAPIAAALFFNVRDYGALGDGTDQTVAINNTLIAASTAGGGTVYAPQGTYIYSSDLVVPSNVNVLGAGRGTIFKAAAGCQANCFNLSGSAHVTISDMQINGNKANVAQLGTQYTKLNGIYMSAGSDDITIMRCYIHDCYVSGIMANGGSTNIMISACRMVANYDNQIYIRAKDTSPYTVCTYGTITGCVCSGGSFSGIQILGSSHFAITGNTCYSNGPTQAQGDGIGSEGANYITITGNTCYNNGVQGIQSRFTGETGGSQSSTHIVIADNTVFGHTSTNGDAGGIGVNDSDDVLVSGNIVYGNAFGMNINGGNGNGVSHCKIIGNQVRGNTNVGIRVVPGAGSTPVILEDNYVSDNANDNLFVNGIQVFVKGGTYSGATGTKSGIHLQTGADKSIIQGVSIYDNTDNGIIIDSPVANVDIRDSWFHNIVGQNQNRALQEQAGAGPTRMVNCRIQNQKTNNYVFNNPASLYVDEVTPPQKIATMPSVLYYDGAATYTTVPDAANLDMTSAVSIEIWYNPLPSQNAFATLFGKNSQYFVEGSGTGTDLKWQLYTNVNGADRGSGLMNTALTPGRLNHLVFTYDSATQQQKIYLNGTLDFTHTLTGLGTYLLGTSTNVLYIGTRQGFTGTRGAKGQMGEVRIWNGALSATDVSNHANNSSDTTTTTSSVLVSRWKSNEGSGTTLTDSVNTNTGTITSPNWNYPTSPYGERPILATGASHTADDIITTLQNLGIVRQS